MPRTRKPIKKRITPRVTQKVSTVSYSANKQGMFVHISRPRIAGLRVTSVVYVPWAKVDKLRAMATAMRVGQLAHSK